MTNEPSEPAPERDDGPAGDDRFRWPTGDESATEVGRTAARGLVSVIVGRIFFFQSLIWLFLGAGFLMGAWALWREEAGRQETLAAFAGRAEGVIEASFWRLRHLADRVHRQAVALPDGELAELLDWAATVQERGNGEELGLLFVDAAVELEADEARSEEVRWQAERLLDAVAFHRPSDNPYRLAAAERARILERLPAP